jgi:hypothetical protein
MPKKEDRDTRYYLDLDLESLAILDWDYDQRQKLFVQRLAKPSHHRVFLTKGQYNKLAAKYRELRSGSAKKS